MTVELLIRILNGIDKPSAEVVIGVESDEGDRFLKIHEPGTGFFLSYEKWKLSDTFTELTTTLEAERDEDKDVDIVVLWPV